MNIRFMTLFQIQLKPNKKGNIDYLSCCFCCNLVEKMNETENIQ